MSFDIRIATREPPTRAMVEAFVKDTGWRISLEGDLAGAAGEARRVGDQQVEPGHREAQAERAAEHR